MEFSFDAQTLLRVLCGVYFLPHTIAKLRYIDRASVMFNTIGLRPARAFVVFTAIMEFVAAFGLISGLYPRIGALIAATILVVASYAIATINGLKWRWQHPGIEYMLFWAAVCLIAGFMPFRA